MVKFPLTFYQALRFCRDFQHLVNQRLHNLHGVTAWVECVCVAPYNEPGKFAFMRAYRESRDPKAALASYSGDGFDVLLVGKAGTDDSQLIFKDLDNYLQENSIAFDIEKYLQDREV